METRTKILTVALDGNSAEVKTQPIYQYDHGQLLSITGYEDLSKIQVHFASPLLKQAVNLMAREQEGLCVVDIPDELTQFSEDITAYVYLEDSESGYTVKMVTIPVMIRAKPTELTLDAPQMGPVNQLSVELQNLIGEVESLHDEAGELNETMRNTVEEVNTVADGVRNMTVSAENLPAGSEASITKEDKEDGSFNLHFGLVPGGHYVPEVSTDGDLSWTATNEEMPAVSTMNIKGPKGDTGDFEHRWDGTVLTIKSSSGETSADLKGEKGDQGSPYLIQGDAYETLDALMVAITNPEVGVQYNVGAEAPYNVYRWTGTTWEDQGTMRGAKGDPGYSPTVTAEKVNGVTTLTITDIEGTTVTEILDGVKGEAGYSPVVEVEEGEESVTVKVTAEDGAVQEATLKGNSKKEYFWLETYAFDPETSSYFNLPKTTPMSASSLLGSCTLALAPYRWKSADEAELLYNDGSYVLKMEALVKLKEDAGLDVDGWQSVSQTLSDGAENIGGMLIPDVLNGTISGQAEFYTDVQIDFYLLSVADTQITRPCSCGAVADESGTITHAEGCPAGTMDAIHQEGMLPPQPYLAHTSLAFIGDSGVTKEDVETYLNEALGGTW